MEKLIILLIFAAIALVKRYFDKAAEASRDLPAQKPVRPASPPLRPDAEASEEERMRKFFEALGIPTTAMPAPKVAPPAQRPPKLQQKATLREMRKPEQQTWPASPAAPRQPLPFATVEVSPTEQVETAPAAISDERAERPAARPATPGPASIRAQLRSPESIREAIILREILGPPRGLQAYG